jgi:hypothetical protein
MQDLGSAPFFIMNNIYFDESGDLGCKFTGDTRYQSSKYLTLAFIQISHSNRHHLKRIVKNVYEMQFRELKKKDKSLCFDKFIKHELKGSSLYNSTRLYLINQLIALRKKGIDYKVFSITVDKRKVSIPGWENDPNLLYNYMIGLIFPDCIDKNDDVTIFPDPRSIKVGSKNSLEDYLKIKLRYEHLFQYNIDFTFLNSDACLQVQLIDYLCNIIWRHHERKENTIFPNLTTILTEERHLFFNN